MKLCMGDLHSDVLTKALEKNINIDDAELQFNLEYVKEYLPYIQFCACFVDDEFAKEGYNICNAVIDFAYNQVNVFSDFVKILTSKQDIEEVCFSDKLGILLTIENGVALNGKISNLHRLYSRGIRSLTITWNGENELASGCYTLSDGGLTNFGKECIREMNSIGMIIDVSHCSPRTFKDIVNITNKPIIASHSCVYNLCKNKRNLTDSQIKGIAQSGGIIGINFYSDFLKDCNTKANIKDIICHILYICNLVGVEHVCLGSDFDGIPKDKIATGLGGVKDIVNIEAELTKIGMSNEEKRKIMGENIVKFLLKNL